VTFIDADNEDASPNARIQIKVAWSEFLRLKHQGDDRSIRQTIDEVGRQGSKVTTMGSRYPQSAVIVTRSFLHRHTVGDANERRQLRNS
jgi:hypothetical protein